MPTIPTASPWYATVKTLTEELVAVGSVSPSVEEIHVARKVIELLGRDGVRAAFALCELAPIPNDPFGRANAVAYLPGVRAETMVLLGHIDTVGTGDYGALEHLATNPSELWPHWRALLGSEDLDHPEEWMFGRGSCDMKSGVAANIAIMRHYAQRFLATGEKPPLSLICIATPDEETQSAGALAASRWLADFRHQHALRYVGLINTDYITTLDPRDPERAMYTGSVGKLLPVFYIVGKATHVGDPYDGIDANLLAAELVRDLSMNPALVDRIRGQTTPPPVTLHAADRKTVYNVQTAYAAWFYLNVLTMTTTPEKLLSKLVRIAQRAQTRMLRRLAQDFHALRGTATELPEHLRQGRTISYAQLIAETAQELGETIVRATLEDVRRTCPATMDSREATLCMIEALWNLSGRQGPAVVIGYAPPFYPHIAGADGALERAATAVAARHAAEGVVVREYFPYLSDMSYMRLDPGQRLNALAANMPLWRDLPSDGQTASYGLPFGAIQEAQIEGIINIGPYGHGAHQRGERLHMPFSFATVPQMIRETIEQVASDLP